MTLSSTLRLALLCSHRLPDVWMIVKHNATSTRLSRLWLFGLRLVIGFPRLSQLALRSYLKHAGRGHFACASLVTFFIVCFSSSFHVPQPGQQEDCGWFARDIRLNMLVFIFDARTRSRKAGVRREARMTGKYHPRTHSHFCREAQVENYSRPQ